MLAEFTADELEAGRLLFARPCVFQTSAGSVESIPPDGLPEIAFAGRSNVGKSTLLNALTGQKTLAHTSAKPGRTRTINFFQVGGDNESRKVPALWLVDLPGYGFAQASKTDIREWTRMTEAYLKGRPVLQRACLLLDGRHGLKDSDRRLAGMLDEAAVSYQVVLTKTDKVPAAQLADRLGETTAELAKHVAAHPELHITSALKGKGIAELRADLARMAVEV